ncbi:hypothetical protein CBR_g41665 [Chara braunii]|uniref:RRM domain-containing protein n=1 Tax=Chara braunii TaxID=69332 RepID=A0A388LWF6_CHABU|nr:hypothetical protein CBR_g41665 [Chara braunii]|eukprot:GBG86601.1 hypothetical protein CBR_g41665 [Chara braunii]
MLRMAGLMEGTVEEGWSSGEGAKAGVVTLIVKHLPSSLKPDMVKKLFAHYGAVDVRLCSASGRLRNCAFVDFKDGGEAARAELALHRLKLVDKVLAVEKAEQRKRKDAQEQQQQQQQQQKPMPPQMPLPLQLQQQQQQKLEPASGQAPGGMTAPLVRTIAMATDLATTPVTLQSASNEFTPRNSLSFSGTGLGMGTALTLTPALAPVVSATGLASAAVTVQSRPNEITPHSSLGLPGTGMGMRMELTVMQAAPLASTALATSAAKDTRTALPCTNAKTPAQPASTTPDSRPRPLAYRGEPIAPSLGVDYPSDPRLEYAYPPPDMNILTNIVNALVAVPRFYTQVLHLMNKMNLPPPFRPAMAPPPLPAQPSPEKRPPVSDSSSSSESEMGSQSDDDDEDESDAEGKEGTAQLTEEMKRQRRKERRRAKRARLALSDPKVVTELPKPVIKKPGIRGNKPILEIKLSAKGPAGVAERMAAQETLAKQKAEEEDAVRRAAMKAELRAGKIPSEEILANPMFKNYQPGAKSRVLYIKNLAKDVVSDDLKRIYEAFTKPGEELLIKLMQEGRMKGQAFVTLPSEDAAEEGLRCSHGYVLKEKAMIVQFGRSQVRDAPSSSSGTWRELGVS